MPMKLWAQLYALHTAPDGHVSWQEMLGSDQIVPLDGRLSRANAANVVAKVAWQRFNSRMAGERLRVGFRLMRGPISRPFALTANVKEV